ncbi:MAG: DUF3592 domain-containing protein [Lachnospiraceae bacterium]
MYDSLWGVSCLLFVMGFVSALMGVILKYISGRKDPYARRVQAEVVDIITRPRSADAPQTEFRNNQVAVFEFFADGRPVKVKDTADTYPCPYRMHQRVTLCYNPARPEQFRIASRDKRKLIAELFGISGVVLILAGCALFLLYAARVEI